MLARSRSGARHAGRLKRRPFFVVRAAAREVLIGAQTHNPLSYGAQGA
jgi:hypothetical protein